MAPKGHLSTSLPYYAGRPVSTSTKDLVVLYHWLEEADRRA